MSTAINNQFLISYRSQVIKLVTLSFSLHIVVYNDAMESPELYYAGLSRNFVIANKVSLSSSEKLYKHAAVRGYNM